MNREQEKEREGDVVIGRGWIKLHRCLKDKAIFDNEKLLKVFIWCLLKATHKPHEQLVGRQKVLLQSGQFVTGRNKAGAELGMPPSTTWEYLKLLESNSSINIKSNNKFSVVTVENWGLYQSEEENSDNRTDSKSTSNRHQIDTNKNENKEKKRDIVDSKESLIVHKEIINYLNLKAGTRYRPSTKATQKHINARLNEGFTLDDFKTVIDVKVDDWLSDKKMNIYLRPETLFSPKFESYLNQSQINGSNSDEIVTNDDGSFSLR